MAWNVAQALVLFLSSALAGWVAVTAFGRRGLPGRFWLGWLQISIAFWALTSGLHAWITVTSQRIVVSQFQYIGIMALPVCWFEFARAYVRRPASTRPWLIWIVPAITIVLAFTNDAHHWLWREIREVPTSTSYVLLEYIHGPWFAVAVSFTYLTLGAGSLWLAFEIQRHAQAQRAQSAILMFAVAAPWVANLIYLARLVPVGFDPTPIGFTISGLLFALGFERYHLFDMVPVARTVLFDSLGDAAFVIDRDGRVVDGNNAARELAGAAALPIGEAIERVLPWWNARPPLGASGEIVHTDGKAFDVQLRPVLDESRELSAWLVVVRDVTERERVGAERRALDHRLMEQQRVESLSMLAGGLAHDFKSLLTGILGNADLVLMKTPPGSETAEAMDAIVAAAERAGELVARMHDYAGQRPAQNQDVDMVKLTADMVTLLRSSTARHRHLEFTPPDLPVHAKGDPTQLRQILLNLINNAAEAAPAAGTITVRLSWGNAERTELASATFDSTRPRGGSMLPTFAVLDVIDDGSGIDARTLARVFDPFFSTKGAGRGLGLSAVLGIVRGHDGAIRIRSQPGEGTAIRVWIPA